MEIKSICGIKIETICGMIDSNSWMLDKLVLGTDLDECLLIAAFLKHLEWSDDEMNTLPKKYTDLLVHIALEKADLDKDKENFYKILNRKNKKYRKLFEKHIILTNFDYNYYDFKNNSFI